MRLAGKIGILAASPVPVACQIRRVTRRAHRLAKAGGLFEPKVLPGTAVNAGGSIGSIRNLFGDVIEDIAVEADSWVIAVRRDPVVHSGDRVAFLATEWSDIDVAA
jgi:predicted deacylase